MTVSSNVSLSNCALTLAIRVELDINVLDYILHNACIQITESRVMNRWLAAKECTEVSFKSCHTCTDCNFLQYNYYEL